MFAISNWPSATSHELSIIKDIEDTVFYRIKEASEMLVEI